MVTGFVRAAGPHDEEFPSSAKRARIAHMEASEVKEPVFRSEDGIKATQEALIEYLLESKSVKDRGADETRATGALILNGRFADDPIKEKSRYCARKLATKKDPTVFAAASDANNSAIIDLLAVKKGFPIIVFDVVAAFSQAEEQELVFLEPPVEYQKMCNTPVL